MLKKILLAASISASFSALAQDTSLCRIQAGSILYGTVLTGSVNVLSPMASKDPLPNLVEVNVSKDRIFSSSVLGCRIIASSYADLSTESIFMRAETLSCMTKDDGFETHLHAVAVDKNSKFVGIKGSMSNISHAKDIVPGMEVEFLVTDSLYCDDILKPKKATN